MEGVTNPIFRELIVSQGGVDIACTEFLRVSREPLSLKVVRRHVAQHEGALLSVQVMGNDLGNMAEATTLVSQHGAAIVDINLGCPAPLAVRKGVGSAMLKNPALLQDVVQTMRAHTQLPLSAKMRAGFDQNDSVLETAALRTAELLVASGIDYLTVHPRRRIDFYERTADWRIIRLLKRHLSIPVVGNGDAWYAADALRMRAETGCDAVMLGRPAMRNPWIFTQIRALATGSIPLHPSGEHLLAFLEDVVSQYGRSFSPRGATGATKELVNMLGRAVKDGGVYRQRALRCQSLDAILKTTAELAAWPAERFDWAADGGTLERCGSTGVSDSTSRAAPAGNAA